MTETSQSRVIITTPKPDGANIPDSAAGGSEEEMFENTCLEKPQGARTKVRKLQSRVEKKKKTQKESCRRKSLTGTRWSGSSADIHYTRNPHKANLWEEIRLHSAGESAVHAAEAITRKLEFSDGCSSSPAARPHQDRCKPKNGVKKRKGWLCVWDVRAEADGFTFLII